MNNPKKKGEPKLTSSYRIDADLYNKAVEKCLRESLATKKRVTLSGKIEELIRKWVLK
jgi:hypothetical protein